MNCSADQCAHPRDPQHPRGLCSSCNLKEVDAYILDVLEQASELVDPEEWPGCSANLRMALALKRSKLQYVETDIVNQLRALHKL